MKIRGFRIELNEIKESLLETSIIEDCFITTLNKDRGSNLIAYLRLNKKSLDKNIEYDEYWKTIFEYTYPNKFYNCSTILLCYDQ